MNLVTRYTLDGIDWPELALLYQRAPLGTRDPVQLKRAYEMSYRACFVFDGQQLVGAARVLSDGEYSAVLYNVAVLPEYQGQGVGAHLITTLLEEVRVGSTMLFAVPGKEGFYEKLGFVKLKTGMGRFDNAEQRRMRGFIE